MAQDEEIFTIRYSYISQNKNGSRRYLVVDTTVWKTEPKTNVFPVYLYSSMDVPSCM